MGWRTFSIAAVYSTVLFIGLISLPVIEANRAEKEASILWKDPRSADEPVALSLNPPTFGSSALEAPTEEPAVLIGAGDISVCGKLEDDRTARLVKGLLDQYPQAAVFTVGDNVQSMGEQYEYLHCFRPSWGQFLERIHPSPGNHDWFTDHGRDYFSYFGPAAGEPGKGYYSFDLGKWHIVSLNSNCEENGCDADSAQVQWLRADLEAAPQPCALLYWHHPLWDSGEVPINEQVKPLWQAASDYHAEVVVNGHDHHYERFAPLDRDGNRVTTGGTRAFIAGTGGAWFHELGEPVDISEARDNTTHGVIVFKLYADRYEWFFVPADGGYFSDAGSGKCY